MSDRPNKPREFTSHEISRKGPSPERKETRTKPPILAHAFVLKSASPEFVMDQIKLGVPLQDLQFSQRVLTRQRLPTGDIILTPIKTLAIQQEKDAPRPNRNELQERIGRALFREWYVRGTPYNLIDAKTRSISARSTMEVVGTIHASPFDELYHGDDESKKQEYASFGLDKATRLLAVPGSLALRHPDLPHYRENISDQTRDKLLKEQQEAERKKKVDIVHALGHLYGQEFGITTPKQKKAREDELKSIDTLEAAEKKYQDFIATNSVSTEQLVEAVRLANLMEELDQHDQYADEFETVLRFIALLPELKNLPGGGFELLKESKLLGRYIDVLLTKLGAAKDIESSISVALENFRARIKALNSLNPSHIQEAGKIIASLVDIPPESYREVALKYDTWRASDLSSKVTAPQIGKQVNMSLFEQIDEIRRANPVQILQIALRVGPMAERYAKRGDAATLDRLAFEAQGKLFKLTATYEMMKFHRESLARGHDEFNHVWDSFTTGPSRAITRYTIQAVSDGSLENIITNEDHDLLEGYKAQEARGEVTISEQADLLREMDVIVGKKSKGPVSRPILVRAPERPIKAEEAMMRKYFLDPRYPKDVFAREIIVDSNDPDLLTREERTMEVLKENKKKGVFERVTATFNEQAVVFKIIDTFRHHLNTVLDPEWQSRTTPLWTCDVLDFKPTDEGATRPFQSERRGGGATIRMSKFYFVLTNQETGKRDFEEVQIFTSDLGKSGFFYHEAKKASDPEYNVGRYMERRRIRSLMELEHPITIFRRIPEVFRKRHGKQEEK